MDVGTNVDDDAAGDSDIDDAVGGATKVCTADADVTAAVRVDVNAVVAAAVDAVVGADCDPSAGARVSVSVGATSGALWHPSAGLKSAAWG